ncbi:PLASMODESMATA CALLOSE-BINDING PROTEIN 3-like [Rhodamnia argentea]|uniref:PLASMODESMATA CALLOSE-BINDING PROTEIN 3-like n=1 Tax=Rhodamnia argentea TaxID=178133 RepID=A0A8B8PGC0_9MYRT|nr:PLASMODESMATA CALLOSE-BINDING PROTEIN 3-like [Rhodamnia argentea]
MAPPRPPPAPSSHPSPSLPLLFLLLLLLLLSEAATPARAATWCVVRSDASEEALQRGLDYACGSGADCSPIQSSGLCYLPNSVQAHAAYAYNSFYQRKAMAPGSCDFAGTATVAASDPSYGSCVYPSSMSTAGGTTGTTPATTSPTTTLPNTPTIPIFSPPTSYGGTVGGVPYAGGTPSVAAKPLEASRRCSAAAGLAILCIWLIF